MLYAAALLIFFVGCMHSVLGGRRLIGPIARMNALPVILGDIRLSRLTLRAGWHGLTAAYWAIAALLAYMQVRPEAMSAPFLVMAAGLFGATGLTALILSRGRHLSWLMFLPAAILCALAALGL
jgi:hypothetical protein